MGGRYSGKMETDTGGGRERLCITRPRYRGRDMDGCSRRLSKLEAMYRDIDVTSGDSWESSVANGYVIPRIYERIKLRVLFRLYSNSRDVSFNRYTYETTPDYFPYGLRLWLRSPRYPAGSIAILSCLCYLLPEDGLWINTEH